MPVIPEDYGQINYRFRGTALPTGAEITLGFHVTGTEEDPTVLAQEANDAFAPVMANLTDEVGMASVLVKLGPNDDGPFGEVASTLEGSASGPTVPPNVSVLVKKITSFGGRRGRGRFYLPGILESNVDSAGTLVSGLITALQTDIETWTADLFTAGMNPALLHSPDSPVGPPFPIINMQVDSKVATQRRRLRR